MPGNDTGLRERNLTLLWKEKRGDITHVCVHLTITATHTHLTTNLNINT